MADDDLLSDARYDIISYITVVIDNLFNQEGSSYDWPTWVQAAILFDECILPCNYTPSTELYNLAGSIVDEGLKNNNHEEYLHYNSEEILKRIEEWMKKNTRWNIPEDKDIVFDKRHSKTAMEEKIKNLIKERNKASHGLFQLITELKKIRNHKGFLQLLKLDFSKINNEEIIELFNVIDEHTVISSEFRREKFKDIMKDLAVNFSDDVKARVLASWAMNYPNIEEREFLWQRLYYESDGFLDAFFREVGRIEFWWGKLFSDEEMPQLKELAKRHPIFTDTILNYLAALNISDIGDLMISLYHKSKNQHLNVLRYLSENPFEDAKELLKNDIKQHQNSTSFGSSSRLVLAAIALSRIEGEDAIEIILENCYNLYYWVAQIAQRYLEKRLIREEDQNLKKNIEKTLVDLKPQTYMISPERAEKVFEKLRKKKTNKKENDDSNSDLFI